MQDDSITVAELQQAFSTVTRLSDMLVSAITDFNKVLSALDPKQKVSATPPGNCPNWPAICYTSCGHRMQAALAEIPKEPDVH
jgi:hypothetical protein